MKIKVSLCAGVSGIEEKLAEALEKAARNKAKMIEVSYGSHAGETKRRILNFLGKKENRSLYHRMERTEAGWGRVFIHFRW